MPVLRLIPHKVAPVFRLDGVFPRRVNEVYGAAHIQGTWYFPAYRPACAKVIADLAAVSAKDPVVLSPEVVAHVRAMETLTPVPPDFTYITAPFQHQIDGLTWLYNHPRAGLFYAPGLGKCKITVDLCRLTGERPLILCPAVVLRTWQREFVRHGDIHDVVVVDGDKEDKEEIVHACIDRMPAALVCTYETASRILPLLGRVKYDALILDESHRIKSVTSVRTRAAVALADRARRRVLLTGTPTLGTPFSLYPQLRLLAPFLCSENWTEFRQRFGVYEQAAVQVGALHQVKGYRNIETLRERVLSVCSRRFLEECVDLPPRNIVDVPFDLHPTTARYYNDIVVGEVDDAGIAIRNSAVNGTLCHADGPSVGHTYVHAPEVVARMTKLEQVVSGFVTRTDANTGLCNGCPELETCLKDGIRPFTKDCGVAKDVVRREIHPLPDTRMDTFVDLLDTLLEDPANKVIVWTRFIEELDRISAALARKKIGYSRVQGGMKSVDFEAAMHSFETDPHVRVYVGQVASGIGVTLNAANYTIYYTTPWSLEHYDQTLARNYRIGQRRSVTVYRLVASGTIDEAKAMAIDQKVDIDRLFTASTELTNDDRNTITRIIAKVRPVGESVGDVRIRLLARGWTPVD